MSTAQPHSPLPWTLRVRSLDDEIDIVSDEAVIATVPIWSDDDDCDQLRCISYANARMIAAACNQRHEVLACIRGLLPLAQAEAAALADDDKTQEAEAAWAVTDRATRLLEKVAGGAA